MQNDKGFSIGNCKTQGIIKKSQLIVDDRFRSSLRYVYEDVIRMADYKTLSEVSELTGLSPREVRYEVVIYDISFRIDTDRNKYS